MRVCPHCGQENPEIARFCLACGAALATETVRQERKVLTALFADLVGFTTRSDGRDPEDVRALLDGYHSRAKYELERHGGTVEKFIGDAVVGFFGAPVSHEDDPERAVRAAIALRAAIAELNEQEPERNLHVRIGITTGEALVTLDARPSVGEGIATGDVVNTAARLQAAAPEDGILVDQSTHRATAAAIETRPHEPISAKGKAEPILVWEVVAARASFGVDVEQGSPSPLVGRQRELEVLAQALGRARGELAPQLVTVIGVPGIGKSRLIWELFRLVDADPDLITWRQGRCLPYGESVAFWALGEMVKAQAGLLETDTASEAEAKLAAVVESVPAAERGWVADNVRPLVGLPGEQSSSVTEAFAAWRRLLESLAEQRPLVLVFEDLHWADDGLLDFVDHLVDWAAGVPLLVVCSARPELLERRPSWGGGKLNAATLALSPLSSEDSARLVSTLLDQPLLPVELQQALLERAGGNPLYAEQYVLMLTDRGLLVRHESGWALAAEDLPLPETLQGIIAARLDGLAPGEKELLSSASVLGKVFWLGSLEADDEHETQTSLHLLERKGFVRRERRSSVADEVEYAFAHALVRDVAYGQIPRIERARKHRRAAEWIERLTAERGDDHAQLAAHHWLAALELTRAARQEDPELSAHACSALADAADRAYRLGATDGARDLYARALELSPADDPRRTSLLLGYGRAASWSGVDAEAELIEVTRRSLEAGEIEQAAEAMFARTYFLWNSGDDAGSARAAADALELITGRPPSVIQAHIFGEQAVRHMLKHRFDECIRYAEQALEVGVQVGAERFRADALITVGSARATSGDVSGLAEIEQGLAYALELNDVPSVVRGYKNLQSLTAEMGDVGRAASIAEDGRRAAIRYGDGFHLGWFEVELAFFGFLQGEWDASAKALHSFLDGLGDRKHYMAGPAHWVLGRIYAERGTLAEGIAYSSLALEFGRAVSDPQQLLPALASNACVLLRAGRHVEAGTLLDDYLRLLESVTFSSADAAIALGELGRERELEAMPAALRTNPWGEAAAAFARGDLAGAAERYGAIGTLFHEAEVRLQLSHRLAADGRGDESEREAASAAAFFRRAGAVPRVAECEAALSGVRGLEERGDRAG
jgi:class 3 adenylate cyclase/tetratricopeptide (TPR) repeat protein